MQMLDPSVLEGPEQTSLGAPASVAQDAPNEVVAPLQKGMIDPDTLAPLSVADLSQDRTQRQSQLLDLIHHPDTPDDQRETFRDQWRKDESDRLHEHGLGSRFVSGLGETVTHPGAAWESVKDTAQMPWNAVKGVSEYGGEATHQLLTGHPLAAGAVATEGLRAGELGVNKAAESVLNAGFSGMKQLVSVAAPYSKLVADELAASNLQQLELHHDYEDTLAKEMLNAAHPEWFQGGEQAGTLAAILYGGEGAAGSPAAAKIAQSARNLGTAVSDYTGVGAAWKTAAETSVGKIVKELAESPLGKQIISTSGRITAGATGGAIYNEVSAEPGDTEAGAKGAGMGAAFALGTKPAGMLVEAGAGVPARLIDARDFLAKYGGSLARAKQIAGPDAIPDEVHQIALSQVPHATVPVVPAEDLGYKGNTPEAGTAGAAVPTVKPPPAGQPGAAAPMEVSGAFVGTKPETWPLARTPGNAAGTPQEGQTALNEGRGSAQAPNTPQKPMPGATPEILASSKATEDSLPFDEAEKRLNSKEHQDFAKNVSADVPEGEVSHAVGSTVQYGNEPSIVVRMPENTSANALKQAGAKVGLRGNQKEVVEWMPGENGAHTRYDLTFDGAKLGDVKKELEIAGINYSTLAKTGNGVTATIFDTNNELGPALEKLQSGSYPADNVLARRGTATFHGDSADRANAQLIFAKDAGVGPQAGVQAGGGGQPPNDNLGNAPGGAPQAGAEAAGGGLGAKPENGGAGSAQAPRLPLAGKRLEHSDAADQIDLVHYSGTPGITETDPAYFGRGHATKVDQQGLPGTYFFLKDSPLGQDEGLVNGPGKSRYEATISGERLYDGNADPLGYRTMTNRKAADQMLIDKGYAGVVVERSDGAHVAKIYEKVPVRSAAVESAAPEAPAAGAGAPPPSPTTVPQEGAAPEGQARIRHFALEALFTGRRGGSFTAGDLARAPAIAAGSLKPGDTFTALGRPFQVIDSGKPGVVLIRYGEGLFDLKFDARHDIHPDPGSVNNPNAGPWVPHVEGTNVTGYGYNVHPDLPGITVRFKPNKSGTEPTYTYPDATLEQLWEAGMAGSDKTGPPTPAKWIERTLVTPKAPLARGEVRTRYATVLNPLPFATRPAVSP